MKRLAPLISMLLLCVWGRAVADVSEFRIEQNKIWLTVRNEPLPSLLKKFADEGIQVEVDPNAPARVTGAWKNRDLGQVLDKILSSSNYLLDWERLDGPQGSVKRLTRIRVHSKEAAEVQSLQPSRVILTSPDGSFRYVARELIIAFGPGANRSDLEAVLARYKATVISVNEELGVYRLLFPAGADILACAAELAALKCVQIAEPNRIYDLPELTADTSPSTGQASSWAAPSTSGNIAVSVLDSGLVYGAGLLTAVSSAFDATRPGQALTTDAVGHGTKMAELAAGLVDPYNRPAGEGVPVVAIKAFEDDGSADSYTLMSAMTYAVSQSDGPISLSWGSEVPSAFLEHTMNYAASKGRLIFAAVGNKLSGLPMYPAACSSVIGIAASDGETYAGYSNQGDFVDLVAPGAAGGSQGTSVATAYVSHIAAKYQRMHPEATAQEVYTALKNAATPDGFLTEESVNRLYAQ